MKTALSLDRSALALAWQDQAFHQAFHQALMGRLPETRPLVFLQRSVRALAEITEPEEAP